MYFRSKNANIVSEFRGMVLVTHRGNCVNPALSSLLRLATIVRRRGERPPAASSRQKCKNCLGLACGNTSCELWHHNYYLAAAIGCGNSISMMVGKASLAYSN